MNSHKYLAFALTLCFNFTFSQAAVLNVGEPRAWEENGKGSSLGIIPEDHGNETDPGERLLSFLKNFEDPQIFPEGLERPDTGRLLGLRDALMDVHDRLRRIENKTKVEVPRFQSARWRSAGFPTPAFGEDITDEDPVTLPLTESITLQPDTQATTPAKEKDNEDKLNPLAPVLTDIRDILKEQVKTNEISEELKRNVEKVQQENLDLKEKLKNGLEQLRAENLANMLKERAERLKIEEQLKTLTENPVSGIRNQLGSGISKSILG